MEITGDQIREERERRGWTQQQLAQLLKVSMRTVGNWERGATVPQNRSGAIREVLLSPKTGAEQGRRSRTDAEPGLRSCSDAELLAEIARRFERGAKI